MTTSAKPKIYAAMNAVLSDIGAITKDKRNKTQGFQYRGIDDVYDTVHPLLAEHTIIVLPEVISIESLDRKTSSGKPMQATKVTMRYTFVAEDGTNVTCTMCGEGMDMADKSTAKALSVAQKYAFFQMFCIPVSDVVDGDADSPEPSTPEPRQLNEVEMEHLNEESRKGSDAFRNAWKSLSASGPIMASAERIAKWKRQADKADVKEGEAE